MPRHLTIEDARVLVAALPFKGELYNFRGDPLFVRSAPLAELTGLDEYDVRDSLRFLRLVSILN
jgi:hypothetical protein